MQTYLALLRVHVSAGVIGSLTILAFWISTVMSELSGNHVAVVAVKNGILWGMLVLIPAMVTVAGTGFRLAGKAKSALVCSKKRRMPIIGLNAILVLAPCAFFLANRASAGQFDTMFYVVQAIELIAGGTNLTLMGLNFRDGLTLSRWLKGSGLRPA
ncbi:hypothetical protein QN219_14125 [Sinorhizobium sp. 7-81]|uniref:hypothetical protein n=1 Tax=Sinorhizobium sp. 8-89 TaxID=3049089 RepID=UPI0024C25F18|nr:hypothetical protein [Sinorhizobium sp. 8-89]MDK1491192.1 hypothetical protein [Sinorhizobium sp. 8-89]